MHYRAGLVARFNLIGEQAVDAGGHGVIFLKFSALRLSLGESMQGGASEGCLNKSLAASGPAPQENELGRNAE
jgi:hypothetical protein